MLRWRRTVVGGRIRDRCERVHDTVSERGDHLVAE
jgi:hypothetical protein